MNVLTEANPDDFIVLNPPYPENERSLVEQSGMYTELYSPEKLHENLLQVIDKMEEQGIPYYMTYAFIILHFTNMYFVMILNNLKITLESLGMNVVPLVLG